MSDPAAGGVALFASEPVLKPLMDEVEAAQRRVLRAGRYILGPEVEAFEGELAEAVGVDHCVGVGNGTDALTIALRAMGIGRGDEVVVPPFTFFATAEAVVNAGAIPVFCDIDPRTYVMTAESAAEAIGPRTAALLPVDLFGNPAPMTELRELADARGLRLLEDAAQALGSRLGDRGPGAHGDAATFSFFPSKNIGGFGDGGAIVTADAALADRARRLRAHGSLDKVVHDEVGFNSRLDELQAAGLRVLLPHLGEWTRRRREVAAGYEAGGLGEWVRIPSETPGAESCFHLYVVLSPERDRLARGLRDRGIGSRTYYGTPLHRQPALKAFAPGAPLPVVEEVAAASLALPMGPALSEAEVAEVATAVGASLRD